MSFFNFFSILMKYTAIFLAVPFLIVGGLFALWTIFLTISLCGGFKIEKYQPTPENFNELKKAGFIPPDDFILLYFITIKEINYDWNIWLFFSKKDFIFEYENFETGKSYTFSNDISFRKEYISNFNKMILYYREDINAELEIKDVDFISCYSVCKKNDRDFNVELAKTKKGNYCEINHCVITKKSVVQPKDITDEDIK